MRSELTQTFYIAYGNRGHVDAPQTQFTMFIPAPLQGTGLPRSPLCFGEQHEELRAH